MAGPRIVLDGGPQFKHSSFQPSGNSPEKVKILLGSGYQHFVHNGEFVLVDGEKLPVFQWSECTKIAE
ncbi:DUF5988 family protein [Nonomuraea sp. NPDC050404]|uniref:DUF5988 family protein n=1 Tax=Nonomuraea sp. NPDC050404 TaxID=3155783 RepID=UPI0033D9DDDC